MAAQLDFSRLGLWSRVVIGDVLRVARFISDDERQTRAGCGNTFGSSVVGLRASPERDEGTNGVCFERRFLKVNCEARFGDYTAEAPFDVAQDGLRERSKEFLIK